MSPNSSPAGPRRSFACVVRFRRSLATARSMMERRAQLPAGSGSREATGQRRAWIFAQYDGAVNGAVIAAAGGKRADEVTTEYLLVSLRIMQFTTAYWMLITNGSLSAMIWPRRTMNAFTQWR